MKEKYDLDDDLQEDEDNFVVDEQGNAVRYDNDEEEEYDDVKKFKPEGQIIKMLGNMQQGKKQDKSTKVPKSLLNKKEKVISNLMNQVGEDDDSSLDDNPKNKFNRRDNKVEANFDDEMFKGYDASYMHRQKEIKDTGAENINIEPLEEDIDIEKEEKPIKPRTIKREKKVVPDDSNTRMGTNLRNRSGIKRTIKQQEEISNNINDYSKSNQKPAFSRTIKDVTMADNTDNKDNNLSYISFNKNKNKLPVEKDNTIKIYWYDAIEEMFNNKPNVIFFGKIFEPISKSYLSISIIIKDIYRTVFILPKPEYENKMQEVYEEFDALRKSRFSNIKEFQCKFIQKKYCFELPVDSEKDHQVLKVKYKAEYGQIPPNINANTFDYIFGKKSSLLENILLKLKIKGPCWLKVKRFTENNLNFLRTWSDYEVSLDDFNNIEVLTKNNNNGVELPVPPMKILSISTQSIRNKNGNELYCICCALKEGFHVEDVKGSNKVDDFQPLVFARKIDNKMNIFKNEKNEQSVNLDKIPDLNNISKLRQLLNIGNLYLANDEKNLLITFITKINSIDPDIIVGHNLNSKHLDLILSRISFYKSPNWTKLSHFKRNVIPNHLRSANNSEYCRNCFAGRLLCDTFDNTKDILFKETNYDLRTICEKHLNLKNLPEIETNNILINLQSVNDIKHILQETMDEAYFTLIVMDKFQILPLTLQLTNIAGCLWTKSLQCSRAARCEMLLLHEFYEKNYLFPDKYHRTELVDEENKEEDDDEDEMNENNNNIINVRKRKPQYSGGLVLEPFPGLYDQIILVMDFNSLYPSIIQEYNISFETVTRKATQSFKEENTWNNTTNKKSEKKKKNKTDKKSEQKVEEIPEDKTDDEKSDINDFNEDDENIDNVEDKIRYKTPFATLPSILKYLVDERKNVKNQQKQEKDKFKHSLLEIKQKSLKITANSLYGYLGYKNSRFYAKEIAALITKTGRRILRNAANIVTKLGFTIIYGDTDSVMVNTNTQEIMKAVEIGKKLRDAISKQYKLLIMDIDGVFKSMLLLKKKKYACLKFIPPYNEKSKVERELKGVDLVRRDWSPLSKNTGSKILDIILSGKSKDEIIVEIYDELKSVSKSIDNDQIDLKDYAITKQLAKNIDEYNDLKALPHVQVAKRLREQGKRNFQIHSFIPYIICLPKDTSDDNNVIAHKTKTIVDRAFHPKEIENDPNLKVDKVWYKENQILPVVKRLVQHITEITMNQLCESLEIENRSHNMYQNNGDVPDVNENTANGANKIKILNLKVKNGIVLRCPKCLKEIRINKMTSRIDFIREMKCPDKNCKYLFTEVDFDNVANVIKNTVKTLIFYYYRKKSTCSNCRESNNTLFCRTKCSDKTCNGYMLTDYDEMGIYQELKFLYELVGSTEGNSPEENNFDKAVSKLKKYFDKLKNKIDFINVNVSNMFTFLNK